MGRSRSHPADGPVGSSPTDRAHRHPSGALSALVAPGRQCPGFPIGPMRQEEPRPFSPLLI